MFRSLIEMIPLVRTEVDSAGLSGEERGKDVRQPVSLIVRNPPGGSRHAIVRPHRQNSARRRRRG